MELLKTFDDMNPFYSSSDEIKDFIHMLYGAEVYGGYKGSVVIGRKINKVELKHLKWINTKNYNHLEVALNEHIGEEDIYININPMRSYKRGKDNIHQYKFLYQDIDVESAREKGLIDLTINQVLILIEDLCKDNILPYPTMTVNSGRGLHLYWSIGNCPNTKTIQKYWEDIQIQMYEVLKPYGADRAVTTNGATVLRVPSTVNKKNGKTCYIVEYNSNYTYSLNDIRDKYFKEKLDKQLEEKKAKAQARAEKKKKSTISKDKNIIDLTKTKTPYTLHKARLNDLIKLIKLRGGNIEVGKRKGDGRRNIILLQISYYYAVTHKRATDDEVREFADGINELFSEELGETEVRGIVRSAIKYASKFINEKVSRNTSLYRESVDNQSVLKNVCLYRESVSISPYSNEWVGLNYNNSTLIELYQIDRGEMAELETLIDAVEKNERDKQRKKAKRRNGEELTPKQREQMEKRKKAIALAEQGLSLAKISTELGISIGSVRNLLK